MSKKTIRCLLEGDETEISKIKEHLKTLPGDFQIEFEHADNSGKMNTSAAPDKSGNKNSEGELHKEAESGESFQKELEKERYFLQTLMDNIPDAIYFKDTAHRFVKVSKYVHLQGLSDPSEAIGKTDFDFFTEEHARQAYEDEEVIIRSKQPIINKIEKETFPSGEIAWVSSSKVPLFNEEGEVSGIVGISRDITEVKLQEEALQKSEERYRSLIEYSPDTIAVIANNGKIVFMNAAGISLVKAHDISDILNHDINKIIHPQFQSLVERFFALIYKNQKPFKLKLIKILTCTNEDIDIEMTGIPTTYNEQPAIQLVMRDVTEVKNQEKIKQTTLRILQASNYSRNTNELFHYIHNAIGRLMPVKNFYIALYDEESGMISFPYFVDETEDIAEQKEFGKGLTEYILRTGKAQLINQKKDEELRERGEVMLVGEPSKIWLGVPLLIKDKTIGVMVVQDYNDENAYTEKDKETLELISFSVSRAIERKKAEDEKLNYIEQLKESNQTKDRFFSFISHDLRGPFSSLLGFSELILEDFEHLGKDDLKRYLEIINSTAKNLYHLLNNLLQFSRFQVGRVNFEPVKFNLKELVINCLNLLKGNAMKKDIELINNVENDCYVFADEEMINSVVQNLLTNAIKFTPRGGRIELSEVLSREDGTTSISVKDSGVGMTDEVLNSLFRVETIRSTSGTEKEAGSGLGLLLTKEFVEKNGGKLTVESSAGKGSRFTFTLPLNNNGSK